MVDFRRIAKGLVSYWPIVVVASFGCSMCINYGYFYPVVGNNFFLISLDDVAISTFGLLFIATTYVMVVEYLLGLLQDSKIGKALGVVGLLSWTFFSHVLPGYTAYVEEQWSQLFSSIAFTAMIAVLAAGTLRLWRRRKEMSIHEMVGASLLLMIACSLYGVGSFFSDFQKAFLVDIKIDSRNEPMLLVGERSDFVVLLDPERCSYSIVRKSSVVSMTFLTRNRTSVRDNRNNCLRRS